MIKNIEMKNQKEETLILCLDYLHFQGVRTEIASAKDIFSQPDLVQVQTLPILTRHTSLCCPKSGVAREVAVFSLREKLIFCFVANQR
jgi:hypothetical protein